jgi:ketosteroid isomerase-like protein
MNTLMRACLLSVPLAFLGCAPEVEVAVVDIEGAKAELLQTDLEWAAAATAMVDAELVASYWSDDAVIIPPDGPEIRGKEALMEFVMGTAEIPGFGVSWEPAEVVMGPSGDFGYTRGSNLFTMPDAEGNLVTTAGRYVTVWQKQADGAWKCVMDIWNDTPPADGK